MTDAESQRTNTEPRQPTRTIASIFNAGSNSLNALRLLLAALVIVSHSWPLTGRESEPALGGANLGVWAVFGFFAISGFLITRSRLSDRPVRDFYRARALRILPAFLVCLVLVACVFAPLSLLVDPAASWNLSSAATFIVRNLALYPPYLFQGGIAGTLTSTPFQELWNGPLWTLFWEAACYVAIGIGASLIPRSKLPTMLIVVFGLLTSVSLAHALGFVTVPELLARALPLFLAFVAGALLLLFADRLRVNVLGVLIALAVLVAAVLVGRVPELGTLSIAYLLLVVGSVLPLHRVGARYDISYGMYIYGWPVQQLIVLWLGPDLPLALYILIVLAVTAPLAWLSCVLVEQPALALKRRPSAQIVATEPESTR
ncbi:MAG: acyltransferase family protein [Stenotrophomonas sp.]